MLLQLTFSSSAASAQHPPGAAVLVRIGRCDIGRKKGPYFFLKPKIEFCYEFCLVYRFECLRAKTLKYLTRNGDN